MSGATELASFFVGVVAGAVAAVAGFGIGSLLTPLYISSLGARTAIAVVSVPHFTATALRLWLLQKNIDRRLLLEFGIPSAAGGLAGALLHNLASSPILTIILACLLIFAAVSELTGLSRRMRLSGNAATAAGALSGILGGLVGNQGGIRSAAMLGTGASRDAFVATATAVALLVDIARLPVYATAQWGALIELARPVAVVTAGAIIGTLIGRPILGRLPEPLFRRVVSVMILALGVYLLTTLRRGA